MQFIKMGDEYITPSKIVCVGKNYKAHIEEMGGSDISIEPTLFLKPNSSIIFGESHVEIPARYGLLHHEVELCFVVGRNGRDISPANADGFIAGYGVGIDFTLRDRQAAAKKAGLPWSIAKGFDAAAVFGEFVEAGKIDDPMNLAIELSVNGDVRQSSNTDSMIFSPSDVLCFASRFMTFEKGDVIMTGTPAGVGEIIDGDGISAKIDGMPSLAFMVHRK